MRHLRRSPCPVCGGGADDKRGADKRCFGWTSEDGMYAHCSREELAGAIEPDPSGTTYAHRLRGSCKCGSEHAVPNGVLENSPKSGSRSTEILETYTYADEHGKTLFEVVRFAGKDFRQRRPLDDGTWAWNLQGVTRVLYRLGDLLGDESERPVYVVEGEKDANALAARGYLATCNPGGAGKWGAVAKHAAKVLKGRDVLVVADADDVGRKHAQEVLAALKGVATSARVLECPAPHKDVFDLLVAGGKLEELVEPAKEPTKAQQLAPALAFDDLWTPEPEVDLVMPGLGIAPGPVHLVTGTWYTGKTLLLATMGLCVASGKWLFGLHQTRRGKWAHFDHEMGRRHIKRYLQRLRRGLRIEDVEELRGRVNVHVLPQLNLCTQGAFEMYCELLEGVSIATIDPLRAAVPGADENKSEFRAYLDLLSQVSDRTRCSIVVLHHGGKPGMNETQRRNTGRGTSAIDDAAQSKWVLSAEEKGAPMLVTHEKTRELTALMDDFYLRIVNEGDAVRLEHMDPKEVEQRAVKEREDLEVAKTAKARVRIREFFAQHAGQFIGIRKDLIQMVRGERAYVERALTEMVSTGELHREMKRDGMQLVCTFVWKGER